MKKHIPAVFLLLLLVSLFSYSLAEPIGYGLVNADRTNIRKTIGGEIAFKLDSESLVYIADHQSDSKGREWYSIVTYAPNGFGQKGWIMSKYVDAGDSLFSSIQQVSISDSGMLALRQDGTVVGVATGKHLNEPLQAALSGWKDIRQVCTGLYSY